MSKLSQAILKIANTEMSVFDDSLFTDHNDEHEELEKEEGMPSDYETCSGCGYDHAYEPEEAQRAHQLLESDEWKSCCASSKTADHYNPYMGRKSVPTTSMPMMEMPELKSKPSHIDLPEMPQAKSKKEVLLQEMQDILKDLEEIESDE